jgi:hypothetical protein
MADGVNRRAFLNRLALAGAALGCTRAGRAAPTAATGAKAVEEIDFLDVRWVEHTYFLTREVTALERFREPVVEARVYGMAFA